LVSIDTIVQWRRTRAFDVIAYASHPAGMVRTWFEGEAFDRR